MDGSDSQLLLTETSDKETVKQEIHILENKFYSHESAGDSILVKAEEEKNRNKIISELLQETTHVAEEMESVIGDRIRRGVVPEKPSCSNAIVSDVAYLPEETKSFPESKLFTEQNTSDNKTDLVKKPFVPISLTNFTKIPTDITCNTEPILDTSIKEEYTDRTLVSGDGIPTQFTGLELEMKGKDEINTCSQSDIPEASAGKVGFGNVSSVESHGIHSISEIEAKDPLETLANAALSDASNNRRLKEALEEKEMVWHDIGVFKGTSCLVTCYNAEPAPDQDHSNVTTDTLPDFTNAGKVELEPGTAYRFRICAVNSCGRGPWSEVSVFRTSFPGYPGAPSSVAISRSVAGALLTWQPPSNPAGIIIEYTVCLAVKNPLQIHGVHTGQKLTLMKVYTGPQTKTLVSNSCLAEAHIDNSSSKPAIIFRIAARNDKGFGPPTQVRWLQDIVDNNTNGNKF